jgi:4-hydroxy-2-oxoheptanedioate aldolase
VTGEVLARTGADFVVVDLQHGAVTEGGVIVPNVRDAEHAREVVAASRYAPAGSRSIGRLSGGVDQPLVIVMVETATALEDLDAILTVSGLDGVYVGPGDLALSLNLDGAHHRADLRVVLSSIIARAVAAGVPVGVHAYNGEDATGYAAEGANIVTVAVDAVSLGEVMAHHLDVARGRLEANQV